MILEGKDDDGVVDQSDDSVVGGVGKLIFLLVSSILSKSKQSNDNHTICCQIFAEAK